MGGSLGERPNSGHGSDLGTVQRMVARVCNAHRSPQFSLCRSRWLLNHPRILFVPHGHAARLRGRFLLLVSCAPGVRHE